MSLPKDSQEKLFTATNEFKGFLPDNDPMMVFSNTIYPVFKDGEFADCYSEKGRNAISLAFLACVTLLQFRENLADTETAEACVRRMSVLIERNVLETYFLTYCSAPGSMFPGRQVFLVKENTRKQTLDKSRVFCSKPLENLPSANYKYFYQSNSAIPVSKRRRLYSLLNSPWISLSAGYSFL
jgi:hypothetical protein